MPRPRRSSPDDDSTRNLPAKRRSTRLILSLETARQKYATQDSSSGSDEVDVGDELHDGLRVDVIVQDEETEKENIALPSNNSVSDKLSDSATSTTEAGVTRQPATVDKTTQSMVSNLQQEVATTLNVTDSTQNPTFTTEPNTAHTSSGDATVGVSMNTGLAQNTQVTADTLRNTSTGTGNVTDKAVQNAVTTTLAINTATTRITTPTQSSTQATDTSRAQIPSTSLQAATQDNSASQTGSNSATDVLPNLDSFNRASIPNINREPRNVMGQPSPFAQFIGRNEYYVSLDWSSLKTFFKDFHVKLLRNICNRIGIAYLAYAADKSALSSLIADYAHRLKMAYQYNQFNSLVDLIHEMRPSYKRLPYLPPILDALPILNRSLQLSNQFTRPALPFEIQPGTEVKAITGTIFLEAADLENYCVDFLFEIPQNFETRRKVFLCIYSCSPTSPASRDGIPSPAPGTPVTNGVCTTNPTILRAGNVLVILNGREIVPDCRQHSFPLYRIGDACRRDVPNRLRIIKLPSNDINRKNLVTEVIGVIPRAPLSDPNFGRVPTQTPLAPQPNQPSLQSRPPQNSFGYKFMEVEPGLQDRKVVLKMLKPSDTDDIAFEDDSISVDLCCPISFARIKRPVRFSLCKHPQCFDYDVFKEFTANCFTRNRDPKCPVCYCAITRSALLYECGWMRDILQETSALGINRVKLDLNTGNIVQKEMKESHSLSDDDEGSDGENGLKLAMQNAAPIVIPEEDLTSPRKSFTFIDLCASDDELPASTRNESVIIIR